jgi:hypothetical protein
MTSPAWLQTVAKIAPTIAAVASGPFAGIVGPVVGTAMGWLVHTDDPAAPKADPLTTLQQKIEQGQMTSQDLVNLRQANIDLEKYMADNNFKLAQLAEQDVESARAREIAVKDNTPRILAFAMIGGFFSLCTALVYGFVFQPEAMLRIGVFGGTLLGGILTYLFEESSAATSYYFGTTQGSATKNEMLDKAIQQLGTTAK